MMMMTLKPSIGGTPMTFTPGELPVREVREASRGQSEPPRKSLDVGSLTSKKRYQRPVLLTREQSESLKRFSLGPVGPRGEEMNLYDIIANIHNLARSCDSAKSHLTVERQESLMTEPELQQWVAGLKYCNKVLNDLSQDLSILDTVVANRYNRVRYERGRSRRPAEGQEGNG